MDRDIQQLRDEYQSVKPGFDVIEKTLSDFLKDALINEAKRIAGRPDDRWFSLKDTQRVLGMAWLKRRVKDPGRMEEKLRKRQKQGKPVEPYYKYINDLVGNRVVCMHPDDVLTVCKVINQCCDADMFFPPRLPDIERAEVRHGDFYLLDLEEFKRERFAVSGRHEAGYTSVHFNFCLGPKFLSKARENDSKGIDRLEDHKYDLNNCMVEVQVRSVLEDAWIEIDHATRYESQTLITDPDMLQDARAMAALMQAANMHIRPIRNRARAKLAENQDARDGIKGSD